jgi:hypothetical protein
MKKGFKDTVDTIFRKRTEWKEFTQEDKEDNYFIFNRYMGKDKTTARSALALSKFGIEKDVALDIWFDVGRLFTRTPDWFWKGATKAEARITQAELDYINYLDLDKQDINLLRLDKDWDKQLKEFEKVKKKKNGKNRS